LLYRIQKTRKQTVFFRYEAATFYSHRTTSSTDLLILDEPTNGLDPNGIIETRELIKTLNREYGTTILVSSHILAEIEKNDLSRGIIHKGKLLFQGTLQELQLLKKERTSYSWKQTIMKMPNLFFHSSFNVERQNGHLVIPFQTTSNLRSSTVC
jgi:ABC-2 type transport system ATP-binding protein